MALRVTVAQVKNIIDVDLDDIVIVDHIEVANDLVTEELTSGGLGATRLKHIELYLSAHLLGLRDQDEGQMVAQWVSSGAKIEYGGTFGLGLDQTRYGQQVKILDTTGTLASLGKLKTSFNVA